MIKAILFDVGSVLYRHKDLGYQRKWETRLQLAPGGLAQIVFGNPFAHPAYTNAGLEAELWQYVTNQLKLSEQEFAELRLEIWKDGVWDEELLAYIERLHQRYKTGIISDAWGSAREGIKAYVNERLFDVLLFSAEEGIMKPDPRLFAKALTTLGVEAREAVFVDDTAEIIEGAARLGIHALHFTEPQKLYQELTNVLMMAC